MKNTNVFKNHLYWRNITLWPGNIKNIFRSCKYAHQRITKGYCDRDSWNVATHSTAVLEQMLIQYNKERNCHPNDLSNEEYEKVLSEMVKLLHTVNEHEDVYTAEQKCALEEFCKLYVKYYGELWW